MYPAECLSVEADKDSQRMDTWGDFVEALDRVPWEIDEGDKLDSLVLAILARVAGNHEVWRSRLREIAADDAQFQSLSSFHSFPRLLMDKFVIYCDPQDRFRVRLHRFNPQCNTSGAKERIHSHKWPGYTLILKGSLLETLFEIEELNEDLGYARIRPAHQKTLTAGDVDAKRIGVPHRVTNVHETEAAYTMFIRGPSRKATGLIFDDASSRCWPWLGSSEAVRKGMEIFEALSDEFI